METLANKKRRYDSIFEGHTMYTNSTSTKGEGKKKKISGIKGIKMKERGSRLKRFFERFFEDFMESLCWNSDTQRCHMSSSELISLNIMMYTG